MKLHLVDDQKMLLSRPILGPTSVTHTAHTLVCNIGAFSLDAQTAIRPAGAPAKYASASRPVEAP